MNIRPLQTFYTAKQSVKNNDSKAKQPVTDPIRPETELRAKFNDHLISFGARVDKGLERFYDANADRMPMTVSRYINSLEDKTRLTPLEAQKRAFAKLGDASTVQDVKKSFPDEELFSDLIEPTKSKATRGILMSARENEDLLALAGEGVLKDKSSLTVYLVKKVFLEGKTVEQINKDLENDLNEDFKADFKFKNKDSQYVYGSTMKSLGIKVPSFEYQQSLRYTRDGYSDFVGDKISQGQREFWDSMPPEDRTARAKKSVENFEKWWNGFTQNQKLDMIADQLNEIDMLKNFKKIQRAEEKALKSQNSESADNQIQEEKPKTHTKIGSNVLSKDELFKLWASNNIKLFQANLSEAEKDTLHLKMMQRQAARWAQMSPAEKTDYISKMKSGAEPVRFAMLDAWNQSLDIIKELSIHLKENSILKPDDLLFSTTEFSSFQSKVMTEFWQKHPDISETLGRRIEISTQKVNTAISRGTFDELKNQIYRDKADRKREFETYKAGLLVAAQQTQSTSEPDYKQEFIDAYNSHVYGKSKSIPKNYYSELIDIYMEITPEHVLKNWTKNLRGEQISQDEIQEIIQLTANEPQRAKRCNRAIEAAAANVLYQATKNPVVYTMPNPDAKIALFQLEQGVKCIEFDSQKKEAHFKLNVINPKFDKSKVNFLYEEYKKDVKAEELDDIIGEYFENVNGCNEELKDYLKQYGKSIFIIFSEKSAFPSEVKLAFYEKFKQNMPAALKLNDVKTMYDDKNLFAEQEKLNRLDDLYAKKFDFVPKEFMHDYFKEFTYILKNPKGEIDLETFEKKCCTKRLSPRDTGKLAIIEKEKLNTENKLKTLAMEQALADVLYEATGEMKVYTMPFEELAENLEIFSLVKKFPSVESRNYNTNYDHTPVSLRANKKPNTYKIEKLYNQYMSEINNWLDEAGEKVKDDEKVEFEFEDLLYILNPDEDKPEKDDAVSKRIRVFDLNLN